VKPPSLNTGWRADLPRDGVCTDRDHYRACANGLLGAEVECPGGCVGNVCRPACVDGETRCAGYSSGQDKRPNSTAIETCTGGRWPDKEAAVACNDPLGEAAPTVCIPLSELEGAQVAVCGDPLCAGYRFSCAADGQIRYCEDGVLSAPQDCPTGTLCQDPYTGCGPAECETGESTCMDNYGFRTCENGRWSATYSSCGLSATTGMVENCTDTMDSDGLFVALCGEPVGCTEGARRCSGDRLGVETCGADGTWGTAVPCTLGVCDTGDATCTAQCKPGEKLCGGTDTLAWGQPAMTQEGTCTANGRLPDANAYADCPPETACRWDETQTLGCVECVGTRTENGYVDTRCSNMGPIEVQVQFCGPGNTWSGGAPEINCEPFPICIEATTSSPAICLSPPF